MRVLKNLEVALVFVVGLLILAPVASLRAEKKPPLSKTSGGAAEIGAAFVYGSIAAVLGKQACALAVVTPNADRLTVGLGMIPRGEVGLMAEVSGGHVVFRVRDTGIGIAREHLEKIFDPFWQVDSATTRRADGTGLGLGVTRRLARLLGGDVTVESQPGVGSVFTLRLPVVTPKA